jgi:acyl-CoA thioesterase-1
MDNLIQEKLRIIVGAAGVLLLIFWMYSSTDHLRDKRVLNPVSYDRFDVVILGDSITEGLGPDEGLDFVSLLRKETKVKIRNSGIRNDTTHDALERINQDVIAHDPDIAIVLLGGNDFIQRVPKEETFSNLSNIVDALVDEEIEVLLVGVPGGPWIDGYITGFNSIAEDKDVYYLPNVLDGIIGKFKYMKDPLHPNNKGHKVIFERILPELQTLLDLYY